MARTLSALAEDLASGRTSSLALTREALARIDAPEGEGRLAFVKVHRESALAAAEAMDRLRAAGLAPSPLAGIPISVKDLFDLAGEPTTAGSTVLADAPAALRDAPAIARLRAAGLVVSLGWAFHQISVSCAGNSDSTRASRAFASASRRASDSCSRDSKRRSAAGSSTHTRSPRAGNDR